MSADRTATRAGRRKVYLIGTTAGTRAQRTARFGPAVDAIVSAGFEVVCPAWTHPRTEGADDVLAAVEEDMTALRAADMCVTLPGSSALWEVGIAAALRIPLMTLAEFLAASPRTRLAV